MNIIVSLHEAGGRYCFRPDTTLEKESFDYYVPDGIPSLTCCPVLFVRICKAGKAINERFAGRYFDEGGCGVLLYAEGFPMASLLDKTSLLPFPLHGKDVLGSNVFSVNANGKEIFSTAREGQKTLQSSIGSLPGILHGISVYTSLRTGDIVAVELSRRLPVWNACAIHGNGDNGRQAPCAVPTDTGTALSGMLDGKEIFSINIR